MTHRTVDEVMTRNVVTVTTDASYKTIAESLAGRGISAVPVVDEQGRLAGVISEADLLHKVEMEGGTGAEHLIETRRHRIKKAKAGGTTAGELMTVPPVSIRPDASVVTAARLMERAGVKRLPVIDDDERPVGIVSRRDLLRVFLQPDASIRQEVIDDVFHRVLWVEPPEISVTVEDGIVTLAGELEQRSMVEIAVKLTRAVDGVVAVVNNLRYRTDDSQLSVPSSLL